MAATASLDRRETGGVFAHLPAIVGRLFVREIGRRRRPLLPLPRPSRLGNRLQHVAQRRAPFDAGDDHRDLDVVHRGEGHPLGLGRVEVGERGW